VNKKLVTQRDELQRSLASIGKKSATKTSMGKSARRQANMTKVEMANLGHGIGNIRVAEL